MSELRDRLNVVVLLADQHSATATGAYGPTLADTPAIDRLAAEGCLFQNAYCNSPVCVPSRLSFLSGRYSANIGAWSNLSAPPAGVPSIAGLLGDAGYRTSAVGKMHLVGEDRYWGFQERPYGDLFGRSHQPDPIASAPHLQLHPAGPADIPEEEMQETHVTNVAIRELERLSTGDDPFLLLLSYNRPHFPLRPPRRLWEKYWPDRADLPRLPAEHPLELHPAMRHHQEFYRVHALEPDVVRRGRAAYYGCVELIDDQVARVVGAIDRLGLRDDTVVVYLSDHGEMRGEHGLWLKTNFYEEAVRVPLIVRHPHAAQRGLRRTEIVELVDLVPTLLDCAGVAPGEGLDGRSLVPAILGGPAGRRDTAISEYYSHSALGPMRMLRHGDWKYCWYADLRPSLFNLREDPHELHDLAEDGSVARMVCRELDALLRVGWDEQLARTSFRYRPNFGFAEIHEVNRSPNQFVDPDGTVHDAEAFYAGVRWSPWTTLTLGRPTVEPGG